MNRKKAFTIIELILAMSVLSILLLSIAMLVIQIGRVYSKGMSMKSLNQISVTITQDIKNSINHAKPENIAYVTLNDDKAYLAGRLCTGEVSYAWNTLFDKPSTTQNKFDSPDPNPPAIKFVRVKDSGTLCRKNASGVYPNIDMASAKELLPPGQYDLVVHQFYSGHSTQDQSLFWVSMILGSSDLGDVEIAGNTAKCKFSNNEGDFCAMNVFEFTSRAGDTRS